MGFDTVREGDAEEGSYIVVVLAGVLGQNLDRRLQLRECGSSHYDSETQRRDREVAF